MATLYTRHFLGLMLQLGRLFMSVRPCQFIVVFHFITVHACCIIIPTV